MPCSGEEYECSHFVALADSGLTQGIMPYFSDVLCKDCCFICRAPYAGGAVKNTGATLHTLHGRISVSLREWQCGCGAWVPYEGAQVSLYAATRWTVFTRTYMDLTSQLAFTGHCTLSSATGASTLLLELANSLGIETDSLTRQTIIKALHRFSRTLLVPAVLFKCLRCSFNPQRPYKSVVLDREVISVRRNQSEELHRDQQDVPVVAIDTGHGACIFSPSLRGIIRKRAVHDGEDPMKLSVAKHAPLLPFRPLGAA